MFKYPFYNAEIFQSTITIHFTILKYLFSNSHIAMLKQFLSQDHVSTLSHWNISYPRSHPLYHTEMFHFQDHIHFIILKYFISNITYPLYQTDKFQDYISTLPYWNIPFYAHISTLLCWSSFISSSNIYFTMLNISFLRSKCTSLKYFFSKFKYSFYHLKILWQFKYLINQFTMFEYSFDYAANILPLPRSLTSLWLFFTSNANKQFIRVKFPSISKLHLFKHILKFFMHLKYYE